MLLLVYFVLLCLDQSQPARLSQPVNCYQDIFPDEDHPYTTTCNSQVGCIKIRLYDGRVQRSCQDFYMPSKCAPKHAVHERFCGYYENYTKSIAACERLGYVRRQPYSGQNVPYQNQPTQDNNNNRDEYGRIFPGYNPNYPNQNNYPLNPNPFVNPSGDFYRNLINQPAGSQELYQGNNAFIPQVLDCNKIMNENQSPEDYCISNNYWYCGDLCTRDTSMTSTMIPGAQLKYAEVCTCSTELCNRGSQSLKTVTPLWKWLSGLLLTLLLAAIIV